MATTPVPGVPDWHFDVGAEDNRNAEVIQDHLATLSGVRVGRAPAVRWAVARLARMIESGEL